MWSILIVIATISALIYWRGPNAVWGGGTLGIIGGLVVAVASIFFGKEFQWPTVGKGLIMGILLGVGAELLAKLFSKAKRD